MKTLFTLLIISISTLSFANNTANMIVKSNSTSSSELNVQDFKFNVVEYSSISDNKNEREDIIRRVSIDKKNNREVMSLSNDALK
jgi:hypothetical protein